MKITPELLRENNACTKQYDAFCAQWPRGAKVTLKNLQVAVELGLDLDWAAEKFLTAPALAEYEKVKAPALAEYEKVKAPAWAEYKKVKASALAEYEKVKAPAWAEYKK